MTLHFGALHLRLCPALPCPLNRYRHLCHLHCHLLSVQSYELHSEKSGNKVSHEETKETTRAFRKDLYFMRMSYNTKM